MNDGGMSQRLQSLQQAEGPFASLYLETRADSELGPQKIETRWRDLRKERPTDEVPEKALLLLDDVIAGAHRRGRGLIAIAAGEELAFRLNLPDDIRDEFRMGALPHLLPIFDWLQNHPPYAVVSIDRTGGEIHVVGTLGDDETIEVEGEHDEIRKVNAGGWSHRRYQNRAEDSWEQNAEDVAEALAKLMRTEGLKLAIVLGDVRARAFLRENSPPDIEPLLFDLHVDPHYRDGVEHARDDIEAAVASLKAERLAAVLEKFSEERGQEDLASDGIEATFAALRMSGVETLLVKSPGLEDPAWFSRSDMSQGAERREVLEEMGLSDIEEAATDEVLVRLALGTGAAVCVIPELSEDKGPKDGVGAILRFKT